MERFLDRVAADLLNTYGSRMEGLTVLYPNKRTGRFLQEALVRQSGQACWLPAMYTLDEWVEQQCDLRISEPLPLQVQLYRAYYEEGGEEPMESFLKTAQTLLRDFDEMDMQLVDTESFFSAMLEMKALQAWEPGKDMNDYRAFWKRIHRTYFRFVSALQQQKKGYRGMAYREVCRKITQKPGTWKDRKMVGIGFSYLNKSEETMLKTLHREGTMQLYWDTDRYYMEDKEKEAGFNIKSHQQWCRNWKWTEDRLQNKKQLYAVGAAGKTGQAIVAARKLQEIAQRPDFEPTATCVVLLDETLLTPMLHHLPEEIKQVNVTMGMPFKETPMAGLVQGILRMHDRMEMMELHTRKPPVYYFKDVRYLLEHPYTGMLEGGAPGGSKVAVQTIKDRNQVFITEAWAKKYPALQQLLGYSDNSYELVERLLRLTDTLLEAFRQHTLETEEAAATLDLEYVYHFKKQLTRLKDEVAETGFDFAPLTLRKLIASMMQYSRLPLSGEPLEGVQVMGLLESRALDFKHVIMVGANEGHLPVSRHFNSLIPYELRREHLTGYRQRESIFAYLFYRLLQRAEAAHLIYDTEVDRLGAGEQSRYLTQLVQEFPQPVHEALFVQQPEPKPEEPGLHLQKQGDVQQAILKYLTKKGVSPTSLSTLINCPLQFYFQHVARLEEAQEVEETIEAHTLGRAIHEVMEALYAPRKGKTLTAEYVDEIRDKDKIRHKTVEALSTSYRKEDLRRGKNYLLAEICMKLVDRFLKAEKKRLEQDGPVHLTTLEAKIDSALKVRVNGETITIPVTGKADRIEQVGETMRIVDYKTGNVSSNELKVKDDPEILIRNPDKSKAFQLLCYSWLYHKQTPRKAPVTSAIMSFRKISAGYLSLQLDGETTINGKQLDDFEALLQQLLGEFLDAGTPIAKTADTERCKYCAFQRVCGRD